MNDEQKPLSDNPFASPLAVGEGAVPHRDATEIGDPIDPWLGIWTEPRRTIRQIMTQDPTYMVLTLALAYGACLGLHNVCQLPPMQLTNPATLIGAAFGALVMSPVMLLIYLYIFGAVVNLFCRLFGGKGDSELTRLALAWSYLPMIAALLVMAPCSLIVSLTGEPADDASPAYYATMAAALMVSVAGLSGLVWSTLTASKGLGEVHEFSTSRGFFAMLLAAAINVAAILGIILFVTQAVEASS